MFNGHVSIIGRDFTYNPVIYLNLTGIDESNANAYANMLSKVLAVARTYMCVPTKIETMWVILDTNYSAAIIKSLSAIHVALKPLEYLQSIISKVAWARPPKNFALLYTLATQLGYLGEEASHNFSILQNPAKLKNWLSAKIDLNYVPSWLGGCRKDVSLTWPPNFTSLENYGEILT